MFARKVDITNGRTISSDGSADTMQAGLLNCFAKRIAKDVFFRPQVVSNLQEHLAAAINWLKLAHTVSPDNGVSWGYSLKGGWRSSYRETSGYAEALERVRTIRQSGAQILLVGMGVPQQEFFLAEHWSDLGVNLAIGVGGGFDVITGKKRRASLWMQKVGLEWLFRLLQEPQRLGKRYLITNLQFIYYVLREITSCNFTFQLGGGSKAQEKSKM
ncbi:WecB/TagA/CpsF family glycosyltransferase [Aliterella atlantica]|uniref:WecB/TagA/CpsF family glycosyltransferase n=1 Tax=Aliterella atlantica TaxID=1827278 RepID=UPI00190FD6B7|nr:WecB/TagA/CpsF family glycosyltransferase [Aliterella atlantica]